MKTVRRGKVKGGTDAEFLTRMREVTSPIIKKKTVKKVQGLRLNSWKSPKPKPITDMGDVFLP